jgi:hypothetical protein
MQFSRENGDRRVVLDKSLYNLPQKMREREFRDCSDGVEESARLPGENSKLPFVN